MHTVSVRHGDDFLTAGLRLARIIPELATAVISDRCRSQCEPCYWQSRRPTSPGHLKACGRNPNAVQGADRMSSPRPPFVTAVEVPPVPEGRPGASRRRGKRGGGVLWRHASDRGLPKRHAHSRLMTRDRRSPLLNLKPLRSSIVVVSAKTWPRASWWDGVDRLSARPAVKKLMAARVPAWRRRSITRCGWGTRPSSCPAGSFCRACRSGAGGAGR
jgi:hypothetical protein